MKTTVVVDEVAASLIGRETVTTILATLDRLGHTHTLLDLAAQRFPAVMTAAQRRAYVTDRPIITPEVEDSVEILRETEALVFVYESQLSTLPPRLKGWIEQVLLPGVGFTIDESGTLRPGLQHVKRVIGVALHSESWYDIHRARDAGRRSIMLDMRLNTGFRTRFRFVPLYRCDSATAEQRAAFLSRVEHRLEQL